MRPWFTNFQTWGGMIWVTAGHGATHLMNRRTAEQLRQIPNLTVEAVKTLQNWMGRMGRESEVRPPETASSCSSTSSDLQSKVDNRERFRRNCNVRHH